MIRTGLNKDLGFSQEDRAENIRRISEVSKLFAMSGQIVFVAFISPYSADRDFAKKIHEEKGIPFYECHISASLEVCEKRDVKGLYAKARAGIIKNFTGISDPYEAPEHPTLNINTGEDTLDQCVQQVLDRMTTDDILTDFSSVRIAPSLIKEVTIEEKKEFDDLEVLDIDIEQVEYLQTIGEGWASPLSRFMNEIELLEVMHMKTLTDSHGDRHLMSVPITQDITKEQKAKFEGKEKIAVRCPKISDQILAVINKPEFFDNRKEEISARVFGT